MGGAIAVLLIVLFGMDLVTSFPFRGIGMAWSIVFMAGAGILSYLSWSTFRKQV